MKLGCRPCCILLTRSPAICTYVSHSVLHSSSSTPVVVRVIDIYCVCVWLAVSVLMRISCHASLTLLISECEREKKEQGMLSLMCFYKLIIIRCSYSCHEYCALHNWNGGGRESPAAKPTITTKRDQSDTYHIVLCAPWFMIRTSFERIEQRRTPPIKRINCNLQFSFHSKIWFDSSSRTQRISDVSQHMLTKCHFCKFRVRLAPIKKIVFLVVTGCNFRMCLCAEKRHLVFFPSVLSMY